MFGGLILDVAPPEGFELTVLPLCQILGEYGWVVIVEGARTKNIEETFRKGTKRKEGSLFQKFYIVCVYLRIEKVHHWPLVAWVTEFIGGVVGRTFLR